MNASPRRALLQGLAACLFALAQGCGGSAVHIPTQARHADGCGPTTDSRGHVEVYLNLWGEGGERPFCPGDHLHPGDALQVTVEVVREAHIHLLYVDPHGESGTLQRQDTHDATRVGVYRIPAGLLTQHVGEAQLFLMVSLHPLEQADPAMFSLWRAIHDTGAFVDRQGHLHPLRHGGSPSTPLHFDTTADLHADFDAAGVAMLALSLRAGD